MVKAKKVLLDDTVNFHFELKLPNVITKNNMQYASLMRIETGLFAKKKGKDVNVYYTFYVAYEKVYTDLLFEFDVLEETEKLLIIECYMYNKSESKKFVAKSFGVFKNL